MTQETIQVRRTIGAPREQLWRAWTDPSELSRWWWPERFQTIYTVELREGGAYEYRTADLPEMGVLGITGRFLLVRQPDELHYTWRWLHEEDSTEVRVRFSDEGGRAEVCVEHIGLGSEEERRNHIMGWNDCIDRLEALYD